MSKASVNFGCSGTDSKREPASERARGGEKRERERERERERAEKNKEGKEDTKK